MHAVYAARHCIPCYLASPSSTVILALAGGDSISIQARSASEVKGYGCERWAPEGIAAGNPAFDLTPSELISALIIEHGVAGTPF